MLLFSASHQPKPENWTEIVPERALAFEIANCSLTRLDFIVGPSGSHHPQASGAWRVGQVNFIP